MYHKKEYYVPEYRYERYKDLESDIKIPMQPLQNEPYKMDKYIQNPMFKMKHRNEKRKSYKKYVYISMMLLIIYILFRCIKNS